MSTLAHRILLIDQDMEGVQEKLNSLQKNDTKRHETLVGVCARLSLVDQIRNIPFIQGAQIEEEYFLYQIDRLSAYLTTTCIDVLTGEHYQSYDQWLKESYNSCTLGENWDNAITELSEVTTPAETASAFIKWTITLHNKDYKETTSVRKGFKKFICNTDNWMREWLLQNYIVEELNSNFEPKTKWQEMQDDRKCKNIAHYLYDLRNLYTHTVTSYQPLDQVQRGNNNLPDKYRVRGFVAIFFPPISSDDPYRRVSLPENRRESDVIRLLVITWIRKHWLEITTDNESLIRKYWEYRKTL